MRWEATAVFIFSLVAASGATLVAVRRLLAVASLAGSRGAKVHRLPGSEVALAGSRAQAQQGCRLDRAAPPRVGSSRIRDWACVSCSGRQVRYQWVTREALEFFSFKWGLWGILYVEYNLIILNVHFNKYISSSYPLEEEDRNSHCLSDNAFIFFLFLCSG